MGGAWKFAAQWEEIYAFITLVRKSEEIKPWGGGVNSNVLELKK
jgi:hypothetical protein